jgi:hypothetical protein
MPLARPMEKEACGEAAEEGGVGRAATWSKNRWRGVAVGEKIPRCGGGVADVTDEE